MMFAYPNASDCHPTNNRATTEQSMGLPIEGLAWPINYPPFYLPINNSVLTWPYGQPSTGLPWATGNTGVPINYPVLAWPFDQSRSPELISHPSMNMWLKIYHPAIGLPVSPTNWLILNDMPSRPAAPWPLYSSDLAIFWAEGQNIEVVDLALNRATNQQSEADQTRADHSDQNDQNNDLIASVLSEQIVKQNIVTDIKVTEDTITVHISPVISYQYARPDCKNPTTVNRYDSDTITVQGLGVQGKAVRYVVDMIRLYYVNDEMKFTVLPKAADVPGIRSDIKVTDEVVEVSMYFIIDRNLSLRVTAEVLDDLYRVETSSSALDRWKINSACALPSIGQLIQQLNAKKAITQLHLDEYKATGTKSWELCVKDEHGRLIFSIATGTEMLGILRSFYAGFAY